MQKYLDMRDNFFSIGVNSNEIQHHMSENRRTLRIKIKVVILQLRIFMNVSFEWNFFGYLIKIRKSDSIIVDLKREIHYVSKGYRIYIKQHSIK